MIDRLYTSDCISQSFDIQSFEMYTSNGSYMIEIFGLGLCMDSGINFAIICIYSNMTIFSFCASFNSILRIEHSSKIHDYSPHCAQVPSLYLGQLPRN